MKGRSVWKPEDGVEAAMELLDGPSELTVDLVPTMDQTVPVATAPPDWRASDTKVITVAIGNSVYPGERFEDRDQARRVMTQRYGRILEANYVPGRAFFRVSLLNWHTERNKRRA